MAPEPVTDPEPVTEPQPAPEPPCTLALIVHLSDIGDTQAHPDGWGGDSDGVKRIEGFTLSTEPPGYGDQLACQPVLADQTVGPVAAGGTYCGTRGKAAALHGFVITAAAGAPHLEGLWYEGVFSDGFRSGRLSPGQLCVSPDHATLAMMRAGLGGVAVPAPIAIAADVNSMALRADIAPPTVSLVAHIQSRGDTAPGKDGWCGVPASQRAIEGFTLSANDTAWKDQISYQAVLRDGTIGAPVQGGGFCGSRGRMLPIYGYVLRVAADAAHLHHMTYEGAFADGYRSPRLRSGSLCRSPALAPLVALRIFFTAQSEAAETTPDQPANETTAEPVRMVIWDLDDVFWGGTLSEGGIIWREENAAIVRSLAQRGIPSTICSKNDPGSVFATLEEHGMRDYFVFPSISWEPKGPRLADLVTAVQLRPESLLFIDDNPMNRAEAQRFVPGLQVEDEHFVGGMAAHPRLQGAPDPDMRRLAHYRVLERRHADQANTEGDTTAFLRDSNITVSIEYDLEPHIDRAIELINRTNQLNFTKARLPENLEDARMELRDLLAQYDMQGAILRVRDAYGDYGYCGLYIVQGNEAQQRTLRHFAFSCRILGMGIETWLYRSIGRPILNVAGHVLTDVVNDTREIDWIHTEMPGLVSLSSASQRPFSTVFARGGCELHALSHYFSPLAGQVIEELTIARGGEQALLNHSLLAMQMLQGFDPAAIPAFAPFGYAPEDFETFLAKPMPPGRAVWLLGFTIEEWVPYYRHKQTGMLLPVIPMNLEIPSEAMMRGADAGDANPALIRHLRENFEFLGRVPEAMFREALNAIFARAPAEASVFVILGNTRMRHADGTYGIIERMARHNAIISDVASGFDNVTLVSPSDFMAEADGYTSIHQQHFDRMVYYRMFRHIMQLLES